MFLRTIPRAAVTTSLRVLRWPLDASLSLVGRGDSASPAKVVLDRADATVRAMAGTALGDDVLRRDAERRLAAADERQRAQELRAQAQAHTQQADEQLHETKSAAARQRQQAAQRTTERKRRAEDQRRQRTRQASQVGKRRQSASRQAAARTEEALDERSKRARLQQLDQEAQALEQRDDALTARDEAQRLAQTASEVKAARKGSS